MSSSELALDRSTELVFYVPRVRVIDTERCSRAFEVSVRYVRYRIRVYDSRLLLRMFVGGRLTTSFHDCGSCWTSGVGAASPSSVDNDSRVCCVVSSAACLRAVTTLGRWTNGAANSRTLLCRRQWIAVESKDRCFDGE